MALEERLRTHTRKLVLIELGIRLQALVEGREDGEELAQIPRYLSGEDDDGNPIPPGKKAKVISIKP